MILRANHLIHRMSWWAMAGLIVFMSGCAGTQSLSMSQYHDLTNVTYPEHSTVEVKRAARRVLTLADDRFKINTSDKRINAERWLKQMAPSEAVYRTDQWYLRFHSENGGTQVYLKVNTLFYSTGGLGFVSPETKTESPWGPAVYELFWNRIDYFLGKTDSWTSCSDMKQKIDVSATFGDLNSLCGQGADDHRPSG